MCLDVCFGIILNLIFFQVEGQSFTNRPYREVLDELIQIATSPVRQALESHSVNKWSSQLIRHACRLLARVVAELAAQACSTDVSCFSKE